MRYPAHVTVPCPQCNARPYQPCVSRRGRPFDWHNVHDDRAALAATDAMETENDADDR